MTAGALATALPRRDRRTMATLKSFIDTPYPAAREMSDYFLGAAEHAGVCVDEYPLTAENGAPVRGREGEFLATHVAVLGNAAARDTIWITTALHGCEGPAGTMLAAWLLNHRYQLERALGTDIRLVIAHNLNPWGASFATRFTHEGVDPNRNFRKRFPGSSRFCQLTPDYRRLDSHLNPQELSLLSEIWHVGMIWAKAKLISSQRVMRMIALGQRADAQKMLFVGRKPVRTNRMTREIIRRYAGNAPGIDLHLDIHTALGKRLSKGNPPLVLTIYPPGSPEQALTQQIFGKVGEVATTRDGKWSGSHVGTIEQAFFDELPPRRTYLSACVELGTVSIADAITAVWRHHTVLRNPQRYSAWYTDRARRLMYNVFFPKDSEWRNAVVPALYSVVGRAVSVMRDRRSAFAGIAPLNVDQDHG
jgi:Protein of unknown function (DUF2817)